MAHLLELLGLKNEITSNNRYIARWDKNTGKIHYYDTKTGKLVNPNEIEIEDTNEDKQAFKNKKYPTQVGFNLVSKKRK